MSDLETNRMLINGIISGPCVCKQQVFQYNLKQNIIYSPKRVVYDCWLYGKGSTFYTLYYVSSNMFFIHAYKYICSLE